jgi:hypothetical protein
METNVNFTNSFCKTVLKSDNLACVANLHSLINYYYRIISIFFLHMICKKIHM